MMVKDDTAKKPGGALGRLMARATAGAATAEREVLIPLDKIRFDPNQPRKTYHTLDGRVAEKDEAYIAELAATIKQEGLMQAIGVRENGDDTFTIIWGECRARAHLLLGLTTIRAVVRSNIKHLLLVQLIENVTRKALSDADTAAAVIQLLTGDKDKGIEPLNQAEVAAHLGKSEGWVTRFKLFGDDELRRIWVDSGIADTPEKVYRLSLLPKPVQMEVVRRASLPEGDPERLEKPLNRSVIDELTAEVKREKFRNQQAPANEPVRDPHTVDLESGKTDAEGHGNGGLPTPQEGGGLPAAGVGVQPDAIAQALAESAAAGQKEAAGGSNSNNSSATPGASGGYQLPNIARSEILGGAAAIAEAGAARQVIQAPINCKVSLANLAALLETLADDDGLLTSAKGLRCELSIPGEIAKQLANRLVGMIVPEQELPATVQLELSKLG